jgi:hypothetical protein
MSNENKCSELPELVNKNKSFTKIKESNKFIMVYVLLSTALISFFVFKSVKLAIFIGIIDIFLYFSAKKKEKAKDRFNVEIKRLIKQIENKDYGIVNLLDLSSDNFDLIHKHLPFEERKELIELYDSLKNNKFYEKDDYCKYIDLLKYVHFLLDIEEKNESNLAQRVEEIETMITDNIASMGEQIKKFGFLDIFQQKPKPKKKGFKIKEL